MLTSFVQIISLPNLRIINVGYGFTGSTHGATAWEKTHVHANHEAIFTEKEFIWADSAYPVRIYVNGLYFVSDSDFSLRPGLLPLSEHLRATTLTTMSTTSSCLESVSALNMPSAT